MKLDVEDNADYKLVRCHGFAGVSLRDEADKIVHPIIEKKASRVLVDLSDVDRITSEELGIFVTLVARANTKGSRVVFAKPTPFVKAIFDSTEINKFLETEDSIEEGVQRLLAPKAKPSQ
jgi:anti-anti-sigma factor